MLPSLDYALPEQDLAPKGAPGSALGKTTGVIMYTFAIWMAVRNGTFRALEAHMVTPLAGYVTGHHAASSHKSVIFFALNTPKAFGLQITSECTSALLLIPLLVMMGSIAIFTRFPVPRVLAGLVVGATLMLAVNVFRIIGIAWATWQYGLDPGYRYSHVFVGSACSLVGFVGSIMAALWVLVWRDRKSSSSGLAAAPSGVGAGPAPAHRAADGDRPRVQVSRRAGARHRR
ncbi:MAG: exosortase/archaeosortase family protein [Jatrophihabitans sp.]|uniref:exosortase/archaeosortase family protein n=1 Tax=Jatrophihabitans sp. TaxID=1932789 RepID=UPI003912C7EE